MPNTSSGSAEPPTLRVRQLPGGYAVCRLPPGTAVAVPRRGPLYCVTVTDDEISVICREESAPEDAQVTNGWRALRVLGTFGFEVVGVMSRLSGALAAGGVPLLACSTFDTDYLLVQASDLGRAAAALRGTGVAVELSTQED
jgi:uncharacterized protein